MSCFITLPRCIVRFLEIKKDGDKMFSMSERLAHRGLESNKMIYCGYIFPTSTLNVRQNAFHLKLVTKSAVDHSFNCFTECTRKSDWSIIFRIRVILVRLWGSYYYSFFPPLRIISITPKLDQDIQEAYYSFSRHIFNHLIEDTVMTRS